MGGLELAADAKADLGEGPVWHPVEQALYWVDITGKTLHRYNPADGSTASRTFDKMLGAAVPCRDGGFMLAMQDGIYRLKAFGEGEPELAARPEELHGGIRFNDGKCDPRGRFWAGTMSLADVPNQGTLYRIGPDFVPHAMVRRVSISNGLAWDTARGVMYYIDTPTRTVAAYDYNEETGEISNGRTAVRIAEEDGSPDGMSIDAEGKLWVALWGGGQVVRYDPATGAKLERIAVPAAHTTSCAFGGANLDELYITTARIGRTEQQLAAEPAAGALFRIRVNVRGLPTTLFAG